MKSVGEQAARQQGRTARRRFLQVILMFGWLTASPSLAFAHMGGMSEEDFRPMAVSAAVAFVSYWIVLLWPSRPSDGKGLRDRDLNSPSDLDGLGHPRRRAKDLTQVPHLKAVGGRYGRDSATSE